MFSTSDYDQMVEFIICRISFPPEKPPEHGSDTAGIPLWKVDWEGLASEVETMVWIPDTDVDVVVLAENAAAAYQAEVMIETSPPRVFAKRVEMGDRTVTVAVKGSGCLRRDVIVALARVLGGDFG